MRTAGTVTLGCDSGQDNAILLILYVYLLGINPCLPPPPSPLIFGINGLGSGNSSKSRLERTYMENISE